MDLSKLQIRALPVNVPRNELVKMIASHLDTNLYARVDVESGESHNEDQIFQHNVQFWNSILKNDCFPEQVVRLQKFHLTEWIPSSPGLFYTSHAQSNREGAENDAIYQNRNAIYEKIKSTLIESGEQANLDIEELFQLMADGLPEKMFVEYRPNGKEKMIKGGIGSLRLGSKYINGKEYYPLGASSTGVCHEGIPILVESSLYQLAISRVKENGGFIVDLVGRLKLLPNEFSLIKGYKGHSRYCLLVQDIDFLSPSPKEDLTASAVISFYSGGQFNYHAVSFCYFSPDQRDEGLAFAVNWLEDYAARYTREDSFIVSGDFDEHRCHFDQIDFPIVDVANGKISLEMLLKYKDFFHFEVNEVIMKNKFENITSSTIIVGSNNVTISSQPPNVSSTVAQPSNNLISKDELYEYIGKSKLGKTLTLLLQYFKEVDNIEARRDTIHYNSQYSEVRRQENLNLISSEDAASTKSKITQGLLTLIDDNL